MTQPVRVLSIAGSDRSGSTLLDSILGTVDGWFSAGELRYLWERGVQQRRLCGCSNPVPECEVWGRVLEALPAVATPEAAAHLVDELAMVRTRYAPLAMMPLTRSRFAGRLDDLVDVFARLMPTIADVTGARVIVDSSKRPLYTYMLGLVPDIELTVVHIVRDPRAVAHSRNRYKRQVDSGEDRAMTQAPPFTAALSWAMWNVAVRSLFRKHPRYHVVRYEDLIARPEATVRSILEVVGTPDAALPFVSGSTVTLQQNHTVSGNPSRFTTGEVELRLDSAWQHDMGPFDKGLVTAMTAPWLRRYGYRIATR